MSHGIAKWQNFDALSAAFPDPLGVGGGVSLALGDLRRSRLFCRVYRGVVLPAGSYPDDFHDVRGFLRPYTAAIRFAARELALAYLSVYVLMYAAGPGLYAADTLIARRLPKPRR